MISARPTNTNEFLLAGKFDTLRVRLSKELPQFLPQNAAQFKLKRQYVFATPGYGYQCFTAIKHT